MRNKLKRQSQRSNNNNLKILLQAAVKQLNKLIDENVRKDRNENWNKFLSKLPIGSKRKAKENYLIEVTFDNGEIKVFDVKPYIKGAWYGQLEGINYFNSAATDGYTVPKDLT